MKNDSCDVLLPEPIDDGACRQARIFALLETPNFVPLTTTNSSIKEHRLLPALLLLSTAFVVCLVANSYSPPTTTTRFRHRALSAGEAFADALGDYTTLEQEYGPVSVSNKPLDSFINLGTQDWMSLRPDNTLLSELSIPGTHDSGADTGGGFCETQDWSISDQLRAGIRFLDIRCRPKGNQFTIHHGICFLNLYFEDVLSDVQSFLMQHPRETIIMRIKDEFVPTNGSLSFEDIWNRYMDDFGTLFVRDLTGIPALGSVRGHVIVLSDEPGPRTGRFGLGWYDGPFDNIQDEYQVNSMRLLTTKTNLVLDLLEQTQPQVLTINHLSATGIPLPNFYPRDIAQVTNSAVFHLLGTMGGKLSLGILTADYVGEALIARILRTNFGPAANVLREQDQLTIFDETGCTGETVGYLDYPGPGSAIAVNAFGDEQVDNNSAKSIQLQGPIAAGSRIMVGGSCCSFGSSDNTVITILADVTTNLCIENLWETTTTVAYEQHHQPYSFIVDRPTSFRIENPTADTQDYILQITKQLQWTSRFKNASPPLGGPILGLYRSNRDMTLLQSASSVCASNQSYWTERGQCSIGYFVDQIDCSGTTCRLLHCTKASALCRLDLTPSSVREIKSGEEDFCPTGSVVTGMTCIGAFCRTVEIYCSKITLV